MIPEQRRLKILEKLKEKDIYPIDDLINELGVSRVTIQRDVKLLRKNGLVSKVHGGVKLKKKTSEHFETRFSIRLNQNYGKKLKIAKEALNYVSDESTIFLDSSTTVYIFAKELFRKKFVDLNIITTSPAILCEAAKYPDIKIISTGGELYNDFNMLGGSWAIDFLEKVNIDKAFISAAGISFDKKITTSNRELANIISIVFKKSGEVNLLVDSTKFSKAAMINISAVEECRRIITDGDIDRKVVLEFKKIKGLELVF